MHLNRMYLMSVDGLKWWFCWFYASSSTWYRIESSEMIEFDRKDVWNVPINENVQSTQNHQCVCMCTQMSPHSQEKRIKRKDTVYNENVHIIGIIIILASLSYIYMMNIMSARWTIQTNICIKCINIITIIFIDVCLCNDRSLNSRSKLTRFYLLISFFVANSFLMPFILHILCMPEHVSKCQANEINVFAKWRGRTCVLNWLPIYYLKENWNWKCNSSP